MIEFNANTFINTAEGNIPLVIQFEAKDNEIICLFGDSGAGKTTVLKMLSGLITPQEGTIIVNNEIWFDSRKKINLPVRKRKIGFVFQEYSLFPHLTVRGNIEFGCPKNCPEGWINDIIAAVGLTELADVKPLYLSGGQKQRAALARAIARKPDVLLLDEPLSALDNEMRYQLQEMILELHSFFPITTVLVSHDISEVFKMTHRVYVIENGRISHSGQPSEIWASQRVSGKFALAGEILSIQKEDFLYILSVGIGNNVIRVIATEKEFHGLNTGEKVIVFSKAFNPIIMKAVV